MILCICLAVFQNTFLYIIQRRRMEFEFKSRKHIRNSQIQGILTFFGSLTIWKSDHSYESGTQRVMHLNIGTNICIIIKLVFSSPINNCSICNFHFPKEEAMIHFASTIEIGQVNHRHPYFLELSRELVRLAQSQE